MNAGGASGSSWRPRRGDGCCGRFVPARLVGLRLRVRVAMAEAYAEAVRVLVTGGAGYIGSHLVDALWADGHEVAVLDNLTTGTAANLEQRLADIRFVNGSILDADLVDAEVEAAQLVFHLAAAVGVRHIVDDPLNSLLVNTQGTANVLASCFRYWRKALIASTSEVYGKTSVIPMREDDDRVLGPTSVHRWSYATAKGMDEHLALAYGALNLPVVIVRYFNSYGPRLDPRGYGSVIANLLRQARAGEPMTVHGDGLQSRCFTYIDDTVRGTLLAAFTPEAEGMTINLGTPRETTIAELAGMIRDLVGSRSSIAFTDYASYYGPGFEDTRRRVPDITRARAILGWEPTIALEDGLKRLL
jgi:UDP-glucose 4-epimerase